MKMLKNLGEEWNFVKLNSGDMPSESWRYKAWEALGRVLEHGDREYNNGPAPHYFLTLGRPVNF